MKAELERITNRPTNSFLVRMVEREERLDFKSAFHYHPEYELIWTISSSGRRFVGNHIAQYEPGDLLFLGKNIPHCWITPEPSKQMVVQMRDDFLGAEFLDTPECLPLRNMLNESYRGIQFYGKTKSRIHRRMKRLYFEESFNRLMLLLDILNELAHSNEFEYLSTDEYNAAPNPIELERINQVYHYIHENYTRQIAVDEAAQLINLTKSAFCKFIKRKTKKTFTRIVNEVRLGKASELLIETDKPVSQICYEVGFNDPSYFFRVFSEMFNQTPRQFRASYQ